jgi:hypothetical protein
LSLLTIRDHPAFAQAMAAQQDQQLEMAGGEGVNDLFQFGIRSDVAAQGGDASGMAFSDGTYLEEQWQRIWLGPWERALISVLGAMYP